MPRAPTTTDAFNAIAEPTRRRLLDLTAEEPHSVEQLADQLRLNQPSISKHLKVLKEVGLVSVQQVGRRRLYSAEPAGLEPIHTWTERFAEHWQSQLQRIKRRAEETHARHQ